MDVALGGGGISNLTAGIAFPCRANRAPRRAVADKTLSGCNVSLGNRTLGRG
jgi:hypothetical protein